MAEDESGYQKMVALIEDVEQTSQRSEVNYISVAPAVAAPAMQAGDYEKVVEFIDEMEGGGKRKEVREKPITPVAPPHIVTSGVAQAKYAGAIPAPAGSPPRQPQPPGRPSAEAVQRHKENILKELGAVAKKFGGAKQPAVKKKKVKIEELVLPNLSLADQISELERIIEGLKENVFDQEHLAVITDEMRGLRQVAVDETKSRRREKLNPLEQSLWDLRNQRLTDAILLIQNLNAGAG
ncbi:MAG: hypothetical protein LVQ95_02090 [Candidatus Micrarchaeales archaeon]|nr:hypothetical protein [Candidatus Micrarchaeales archaeon]